MIFSARTGGWHGGRGDVQRSIVGCVSLTGRRARHSAGACGSPGQRYLSRRSPLLRSVRVRVAFRTPNGCDAKDVAQVGALIQALKLELPGIDAGFAWLEAWDRGERWRQALAKGGNAARQPEPDTLTALMSEACEAGGKNPAD
jgi:hypothetical protein